MFLIPQDFKNPTNLSLRRTKRTELDDSGGGGIGGGLEKSSRVNIFKNVYFNVFQLYSICFDSYDC